MPLLKKAVMHTDREMYVLFSVTVGLAEISGGGSDREGSEMAPGEGSMKVQLLEVLDGAYENWHDWKVSAKATMEIWVEVMTGEEEDEERLRGDAATALKAARRSTPDSSSIRKVRRARSCPSMTRLRWHEGLEGPCGGV